MIGGSRSRTHIVRFEIAIADNDRTGVVMTLGSRVVRGRSATQITPWLLDDPKAPEWEHFPAVYRFRFGRIQEGDRDVVARGVGDLLAPGDLHDSLTELLQQDTHARTSLVLRLAEPRLAAVPWELARVRSRRKIESWSDVVRNGHPLVRQAGWALGDYQRAAVSRRVLVVRGSDLAGEPRFQHGDSDPVWTEIRQRAIHHSLEYLDQPTRDDLRVKISSYRPGIIHFAAHGVNGGAEIQLLDGPFQANELVSWLDQAGTQVVMLSVCESGRWSPPTAIGFATELVRRGVPAVLAMRTRVKDGEAADFTAELYGSLASGLPLESCVAVARARLGDDWASPALYLTDNSFSFVDAAAAGKVGEWVQIAAGRSRRRLALGPTGPVDVPASEGADAAPAGFGLNGDLVASPDGLVVAWLSGSTVACAWIGDGHSELIVTPWPETFDVAKLGRARLLAIRLRGQLAVEAIITTDDATLALTLERGGSWYEHRVLDTPSIAACFIGSQPFTVDRDGHVHGEPLASAFAGVTPVDWIDAADDGGRGVTVATAGRDGSAVLAWCESGADRVIEEFVTAERVVLERRLRPEREPWGVLECAGTRVARRAVR